MLRIRWIRKILASWIRIRKNMRIHGSGSKGVINQKLPQKKLFYSQKPNLNFWNKRDYKYFLISERFIEFQDKNKTKNLKIIFCYKNSVNLRKMTWIRIVLYFFGLSVIICLLYVKMLHITVITPLQRTNATGIKIIDSLRFRRHMFEQVNVFIFFFEFINAFFLFCSVVSFLL